MYNLVLLCKSYIGDINRIIILKDSIDRFNADNIPFCIVCPQKDINIFKEKLINGNESYPIHIFSDEEILNKLELASSEQSWTSQQIIKLGFYKMGICNHYSILDSDCYFIDKFNISDFMYDEKTPYIYINVQNKSNDQTIYIKDYLGRKGKYYNFIQHSQVFSRVILEDMENNFLKKSNLTFNNLIDMCPYEFNWYGEYFIKCGLLPIHLRGSLVKTFWFMEHYICARWQGLTVEDFINEGYKAILMQNRWVKGSVYKPHPLHKILSTINKLIKHTIQILCKDTSSISFAKKIEFYCKNLIRENIKIIFQRIDKMPKISIIIPIYNTEEYLAECIESVINQSYKNIEIILINDGSSKNADEICNEYVKKDSKIKYFSKHNEDVAIARNFGISKATGDYIFCMDSDDTIEKDFIKKVVKVANKTNAELIVIGDWFCRKRVEILGALSTCGFVVKKSMLDKYPDVGFIEAIQPCEDGLYSHKLLALTQKVAKCPDAIYNYRRHENIQEELNQLKEVIEDKSLKNLEELLNE